MVVAMSLRSTAAGIEICITDKGSGFDPQKVPKGRSLAQLQSRANRQGADLAWQRLNPGMLLTLILQGGGVMPHDMKGDYLYSCQRLLNRSWCRF